MYRTFSLFVASAYTKKAYVNQFSESMNIGKENVTRRGELTMSPHSRAGTPS